MQVYVHGRNIEITRNLTNALKNLRHIDEPRALWIDALCICQTDKAEKNIQIPLMSHIYGSTQLVIIYLGIEEKGSENIPAFCHTIHKVFDSSGILIQPGKRPRDDGQLALDGYTKCGLPSRDDSAWDCFRALLSRPWFTRIWVIQEFCLATNTYVICGKWRMPFKILLLAVYYAVILDLPVYPKPGVSGRKLAVQMLSFMQWLGADQPRTQRLKLLYLLDRCRNASATDLHDYCYGLMALSADTNSAALQPDYNQLVRDDYLRFAKYFINQGNGIVVLYNAGRQTLQMPSWVPDWSHRDLEYLSLCPNPAARPETTKIYTAALGAEPSLRLHARKSDSLIVRGIMFDSIAAVGEVHVLDYDFSTERRKQIVSTMNKAASPELLDVSTNHGTIYWQNVIEIQSVADYVWDLRLFLQDRQGELLYPTGEDFDTVTWKTAICNSSGTAG